MAKKYNLTSKSDMRRFERDLKKSLLDQAKNAIMNSTHEIECPSCKRKISAHIGLNTCSYCGQTIDLNLNM